MYVLRTLWVLRKACDDGARVNAHLELRLLVFLGSRHSTPEQARDKGGG